MKVAVVDQTGDLAGGAQQSLASFLHNVPPGVTPTVVFFKDGAFAARIRGAGVAVRILPLDERVGSATRERLPAGAALALPGALRDLVRLLRELEPDVVYTNGVKAHALGAIAARLAGIPCVPHHRDLLRGTARAFVLAVLALCTQARIATSRNVAACYPLPKTTIVDNPVELAAFSQLPDRVAARAALGIAGDVPVAAIVGRINRWKGIDRFLRAVAAVNARTPLRGLVVGAPHFRDADLLPELRALCTRLSLEGLVTFVDWVEDPRAIYAAIDINVNASDREPFGRTIVEAAAAGVPSVCFDDAGVAETMLDEQTGRVVKAGDTHALADAIFTYAHDAPERERAAAEARRWSARFDSGSYARRISEILSGVRR